MPKTGNSATALEPAGPPAAAAEQLTLIDVDCHNISRPDSLDPYLDERWVAYRRTYGIRTRMDADLGITLRPFAARNDAFPPNGTPGSDPDFTRAQLLDEYGIDIAILNNIQGQIEHVGGNQPAPFSQALQQANNDWARLEWLAADPRWRASICVPFEEPDSAAEEIRRCRDLTDRFVAILIAMKTQRPIGHQKYWPIFEAAAAYGIPVTLHPGGNGMGTGTGTGSPSYYFEMHAGHPFGLLSTVASLIFEGVLDRWPSLKLVIIEGGWSWVVPYARRLDAAYDLHRGEVGHLQRRPSEYLREHFWFTTQPLEEPENPRWFPAALEQFGDFGLAGHLMYSSDYPHWDFDPPSAVPRAVRGEERRRVMCGNAQALYGFPAVQPG
jgi:uncharacterized protein